MPRKRGRSLFELLPERDEEDATLRAKPTVPYRERQRQRGDRGASGAGTRTDVEIGGAAAGDPPGEAVPFVEVDGDRVRVALTSVTGAVAVFGLLAVLFAAFHLGRGSGYRRGYVEGRASFEADAVDEVEAARNLPPASHLVDGLLDDVNEATGSSQAGDEVGEGALNGPRWVRDHTYIVVQEFPDGNVEAADRAKGFLATRSIDTEIVRRPSGGVQLITTEGYNIKDPTQKRMAEALREKVHAAGAEYYRAGGGYRLEGYLKTLKRDDW
ncbi:MAG: hypothetical protein PVI86_12865 [Phycisphaerae bacterium]|jgi:hypothetical protein